MLQQTQVGTVLPYYRRFLKRFPDLESLAAAPENDVLALWAGLGYYSRARNLRLAARKIINEFGGCFPESRERLLELPGVGRYTAGAIRSIAFDVPEPVVDGNVKRVLSRLHGISCRPPESFFWEQAEAWLSRGHPSDFNQAVMELGALVCTRRRPACLRCPVREFCRAHREGIQDRIPASRTSRVSEGVELLLLVVQRADEVLVTPKRVAAFIPGRYSLPGCIVGHGRSPEATARRLARGMLGSTVRMRRRGFVRHAITFRRIGAHVFRADAAADCRPPEGCLWISRSQFKQFVSSSIYDKALMLANS